MAFDGKVDDALSALLYSIGPPNELVACDEK
jgi:hypothetical protein